MIETFGPTTASAHSSSVTRPAGISSSGRCGSAAARSVGVVTSSRRRTSPVAPSTSTRSPSATSSSPIPHTAGTPHWRAMIAAWLATPPRRHTIADATRIAGSSSGRVSSTSSTTSVPRSHASSAAAGSMAICPTPTPGDAARPTPSRTPSAVEPTVDDATPKITSSTSAGLTDRSAAAIWALSDGSVTEATAASMACIGSVMAPRTLPGPS